MKRSACTAVTAAFWAAFFMGQASAQAPPEHENHNWLQHKRNESGQSCCKGGHSGDCQPVGFDEYSEDAKGGVKYGRWYFPPGNVLPTEDSLGRPVMCIWNGQPRCAFVPHGY